MNLLALVLLGLEIDSLCMMGLEGWERLVNKGAHISVFRILGGCVEGIDTCFVISNDICEEFLVEFGAAQFLKLLEGFGAGR
jgi:hypothetical protein